MFTQAIKTTRGSIFPIIRNEYKDTTYKQMNTSVAGTGFFINDQGYFVTAAHVVTGNPQLVKYGYLDNIPNVAFSGIQPEPIKTIGVDQSRDLYVGIVTKRLHPPVKLRSNNAPLGSSIIIGGYPFPQIKQVDGNFQFDSVRQFWQPTMIMDYLHMSLLTQYPYNGFLISDRAIPGMSGGPVMDVEGNVVGMCTATIARKSGNDLPHFNGICLSAAELTIGINQIMANQPQA